VNSLKVQRGFVEATEELSDAEMGRLFRAMMKYAFYSEEPSFSGNEKFLWKTTRKDIDLQRAKYSKQVASLEHANSYNSKHNGNPMETDWKSNGTPLELHSNSIGNPMETHSNSNPKERTKEKRDNINNNNINNNNISKDTKEDIPDIEAMFGYNQFLLEAVKDWMTYKKQKRQSYQGMGLKSFLTQVQNRVAEYGEDAVIQVIRDSMAANYTGIVWDWLKKQTRPQNTNSAYSFMDILRREEQNEQNRNSEAFSPFAI